MGGHISEDHNAHIQNTRSKSAAPPAMLIQVISVLPVISWPVLGSGGVGLR